MTKPVNTYEQNETDKDLEENGAWVEIRPGLFYRIRSTMSTVVRKFDHELMKKQRGLYMANNGILPLEQQDRNDVIRTARAILADWRGQTDRQGNLLEFNVANAENVMKELARLRYDTNLAAATEETFRKEGQKALEGN